MGWGAAHSHRAQPLPSPEMGQAVQRTIYWPEVRAHPHVHKVAKPHSINMFQRNKAGATHITRLTLLCRTMNPELCMSFARVRIIAWLPDRNQGISVYLPEA